MTRWFLPVEIRPSGLHGKGAFASEYAKRGAVLAINTSRELTTIDHYKQNWQADPMLARTASRLIGDYFAFTPTEVAPDDYINHSDQPNVLLFVGIYLALRDIQPGDELTVDYNHYFAPDSECELSDAERAANIRGMSGRDSLIASCRQLLQLVEEEEGWTGR